MPLKKTIVFALIVIAALLIPLIVLLALPDASEVAPEITDAPSVQVLFDQNHTEHIDQLRFTNADEAPISISRTENGWQITGRPGLPISADTVEMLLSPFSQMLALRTITEQCGDLAEYGLDTPILTVTLTDHDGEKTYLFGNSNHYYEGYYCMAEGSSAVYLLDYAYVTAFDLTVDDLLLTEELPDLSAISELRWTSSAGVVAEDASSIQPTLAALSIDRMVDYGSEQYAVYGLDRAATAECTLSDGNTVTLHFSVGETDELIYLTIDDREIIYLVTCKDTATLPEWIRLQ